MMRQDKNNKSNNVNFHFDKGDNTLLILVGGVII